MSGDFVRTPIRNVGFASPRLWSQYSTEQLSVRERAMFDRARPGFETVLSVDDQDDVRSLLAEVLRIGAYRVLEAKHGIQALALAEAQPEPIGLLVTDLIMPGISGVELADGLRTRPAA
jgi:response regulator RpfG family c-di-GMP phosphodiesterase